MLRSLSGRFLLLTVVFVMLAEVLIFVPSTARFRQDFLLDRLERAQIAALTVLAVEGALDADVEAELLANAGVYNVVLRRDALRQLVLSSDLPGPVARTVDLRDPSPATLIADALRVYADPEPDIIRVIAEPVRGGGLQIEAAMSTAALRAAMIDYGLNILILSAIISAITAASLFLAVRRLMVLPIRELVAHMKSYAAAPEDARRVIAPRSRVRELREAEGALQEMEEQLTRALRQKDRLAQLGAAVAKISHDLRNILTTATLLADRMEGVDDPTVRRVAPKLVGSLARAVSLTEGTLAFGRAEEAPPRLSLVSAERLLAEVVEAEALAAPAGVRLAWEAPPGLVLRCDPEQMHRVLTNLVRNACQAIEAQARRTGGAGEVRVRAEEGPDAWCVRVADTGPGLPERAREHLFAPFRGASRKGGTGLGLAIAAELVRGHGGTLTLERTGEGGTEFLVRLPRGVVDAEASEPGDAAA